MLAWCVGTYASGSTWAFNAIRSVARLGGDVDTRFVNTMDDMAGLETGRHAVKSHDVPADVAALLAARATGIVVTFRDPRDAVTSLMRYQNFPFELALDWVSRSSRFAVSVAQSPIALALRYEDGFCDLPATISRIGANLATPVDDATRAGIFENLRRPAVEEQIARFPERDDLRHDPQSGDIEDPVTRWHRHHAGRDGAVRRWRHTLTRSQAQQVRAALADLPQLFHPRPLPGGAGGR